MVAMKRWTLILATTITSPLLLSGSAPGTIVRRNTISGNADVGIYVAASEAMIAENTLLDEGADGFYDIGIVNFGEGNAVRDNDVRGFGEKYFGVESAGVPGGMQVE